MRLLLCTVLSLLLAACAPNPPLAELNSAESAPGINWPRLAHFATPQDRGQTLLAVAESADASRTVAVSHTGLVHIWEEGFRREVDLKPGDRLISASLALDPNGRFMVIGTKELAGTRHLGRLACFNAQTLQPQWHLHHYAGPLLISRDGAELLAVTPESLQVRSLETGELRRSLPLRSPGAAALSDTVVAIASGSTIRVNNLETGRPVARFSCPETAVSLSLTPDGRYLAASSVWVNPIKHKSLFYILDGVDRPTSIHVWDLATSRELARLHTPRAGTPPFDHEVWYKITISPDGRRVVASSEHTLLIDIETGSLIAREPSLKHGPLVFLDTSRILAQEWDHSAVIVELPRSNAPHIPASGGIPAPPSP